MSRWRTSIIEKLKTIEQSPDVSSEVSVAFSIYDGGRAIDFVISKNILEIIVSDKVDFSIDRIYQKVFKGFYRVRRNDEWWDYCSCPG